MEDNSASFGSGAWRYKYSKAADAVGGGCATVKVAAGISAIDQAFPAGQTEIVELMGRRSGTSAHQTGVARKGKQPPQR